MILEIANSFSFWLTYTGATLAKQGGLPTAMHWEECSKILKWQYKSVQKDKKFIDISKIEIDGAFCNAALVFSMDGVEYFLSLQFKFI
jgi:hypothetical protein